MLFIFNMKNILLRAVQSTNIIFFNYNKKINISIIISNIIFLSFYYFKKKLCRMCTNISRENLFKITANIIANS